MKEYKQLTQEQRYQIQASRKAQMSMRAISRGMGVSPSTISRELKRNTGQRGYRPKQAHQKAQERHEQKRKAVRMTEKLESFIFNQLTHYDSSPEQISGRMKLEFGYSVSHETIYQYLLRDKADGGELYLHLRHKAKKYRKRYGSADRRGQITNRVVSMSVLMLLSKRAVSVILKGILSLVKTTKGLLSH